MHETSVNLGLRIPPKGTIWKKAKSKAKAKAKQTTDHSYILGTIFGFALGQNCVQ
jgi:hypothetical protein